MKKIAVLASILFGSFAHASCPDLTGTFVYTAPDSTTEKAVVTQSEANGVTTYVVVYDDSYSVTAIADGSQQTINEKNGDVSLSSVYSFSCGDNTLVQNFNEKAVAGDGSVLADYTGTATFTRSSELNLVVDVKSTNAVDGKYEEETYVYVRQ